jgi:hypothetical protein
VKIHRDPKLQWTAVRDTLAALDAWKIESWLSVRADFARADALERAAEDVPRADRPPTSTELAAKLSTGELDPAEVPRLLKPTDAAEQDLIRATYTSAARQARRRALDHVQRYGERLTSDVRPVAAAAINRGDGATWLAVCEVLDSLRSAGLLPTRSGSAADRSFDPWEFRVEYPELLPTDARALPPDQLLAATHASGARPGLYDDRAVLERYWSPRQAAAIGG